MMIQQTTAKCFVNVHINIMPTCFALQACRGSLANSYAICRETDCKKEIW